MAAADTVLGTTVLRDLTDGVLTITLNRPEAANAVNADQRNVVIELLNDASGNHEVRVVVIASNGRHFCSGADVSAISPGAERRVGDTINRIMTGAQRLVAAILDCAKPVIAVVQGAAAELFKVWAATVRAGLAPLDGRIVLCLHDELLLHVPEEAAPAAAGLLRDALRDAAGRWASGTGVRFAVEVGTARRWSDAKT